MRGSGMNNPRRCDPDNVPDEEEQMAVAFCNKCQGGLVCPTCQPIRNMIGSSGSYEQLERRLKDERERCAKVVEHFTGCLWPTEVQNAAKHMLSAIREPE